MARVDFENFIDDFKDEIVEIGQELGRVRRSLNRGDSSALIELEVLYAYLQSDPSDDELLSHLLEKSTTLAERNFAVMRQHASAEVKQQIVTEGQQEVASGQLAFYSLAIAALIKNR